MVEHETLLLFGGVTRQVDLAFEIRDIPAGSNEWLIAADIMNGDILLTPDQNSWFYSDAVDRSFVYIAEDYRGGLLKVKGLTASVDFDRIRLSLIRVPWAKQQLIEDHYPRLVRIKYAAHRVSMSLKNAVVEPVHLLGEVNP